MPEITQVCVISEVSVPAGRSRSARAGTETHSGVIHAALVRPPVRKRLRYAWPPGVTAALTARTDLGIRRGRAGCARGLPPTHVRAPRSATAGRSPAGHRPSGTGCPDAASPGRQKEQVRSRLHTAPVPTGLCRATTFSAAFWPRAWHHARTSRPQIWRPSSISPVPWQWCGCCCCDNRTATIVRKLVGLRAATQAGRPGHTARTHGRPRSPS